MVLFDKLKKSAKKVGSFVKKKAKEEFERNKEEREFRAETARLVRIERRKAERKQALSMAKKTKMPSKGSGFMDFAERSGNAVDDIIGRPKGKNKNDFSNLRF